VTKQYRPSHARMSKINWKLGSGGMTPTDAKRPVGVISLVGGYRGTPSPRNVLHLSPDSSIRKRGTSQPRIATRRAHFGRSLPRIRASSFCRDLRALPWNARRRFSITCPALVTPIGQATKGFAGC